MPLFPPHHTYVEPFGGSGSVLLNKRRAPVEIYNDRDLRPANLLRVLQNPTTFPNLFHRADLTLYSRLEYMRSLVTEIGDPAKFSRLVKAMLAGYGPNIIASWLAEHPSKQSDMDRAYRWLILTKMNSRGMFFSGWGYTLGQDKRSKQSADTSNSGQAPDPAPAPVPAPASKSVSVKVTGPASTWRNVVRSLPNFHERLQRVTIENSDWRDILARYDGAGPGVFMYLDPPYVTATRTTPNQRLTSYEHEMTDRDHQEMVRALLKLKAYVILSGYNNDIYKPLVDAGWRRFYVPWKVRTNMRPKKRPLDKDGKPVKPRKPKKKRDEKEWIWVCPALAEWVSFVGPVHGWVEA